MEGVGEEKRRTKEKDKGLDPWFSWFVGLIPTTLSKVKDVKEEDRRKRWISMG